MRGASSAETIGRYGIGAVFGTRIPLMNENFYIGSSFNAGIYLDKAVPVQQISHIDLFLDTVFDVQQDYFFNIELLKIGMRFQ